MAWGLGVLQETKFHILVLIHSLKALYDFERNKSFLRMVPTKKEVFLPCFMTMQGKQVVARAVGIQKENWG